MKNIGKVVAYDLNRDSQKWVKKFNYLQNNLLCYNDVLIQTSSLNSTRLDIETGLNQWQINKQIVYIDPLTQMGLAYPLSTEQNPERLEGFYISDGYQKWFRTIKKEYGWNDLFHLNDSVILLSASGLHTIKLKTGFGWDYDAVTGSKDYTSSIIANSAGLILGALTGTFVMYSGYDFVTDVVSNVWLESTCMFLAAREKIACLDMNGKMLWQTELPKKKASKSVLFIQDSIVYMVNLGYAKMGFRQVDFGVPFIAAFNKFSGRQIYLNELPDKKEPVVDYLTGAGELILLFKDYVAKYSIAEGRLISERQISVDLTGKLTGFGTGQFYEESDSVYQPIEAYNPDKIFLITDSLKVLTLNN
jgi:hypothetical protein